MAKDLLMLYEPINRGSRFMDEVVFFHRQSQTLIGNSLLLSLTGQNAQSPDLHRTRQPSPIAFNG